MVWLLLILFFFLTFGAIAFYGAPYVPSQKKYIKLALHELYPLGKKDLLVDIGSGGGVVLREASKFGARAVGYELNPVLFGVSWLLSRKDKRVNVQFADYWTAKIPDDTTIVYVFSVMRDMKRIGKWVQNEATRLKHPLNLISFGFELVGIPEKKSVGAYHLYVIQPLQPAEAQV
jgi:SAM-dependent methyltransferase